MKLNKKFLYGGIAILIVIVISGALVSNGDAVVNKIKRPDYSKQTDTYSLTAKVGNDKYQVKIPVEPMKISDENLQSCFDEAFEIVCKKMLGKNVSLTQVKENLIFVDEVEKYGISVSYSVSDYSLISSTGEVKNQDVPENGKECVITIYLEYEEMIQSYKVKVNVYPPDLSEEQSFLDNLSEAVQEENNRAGEEYLELPESVDGREVVFIEEADSKIPIIVVLLLIILLVWYYRKFVVKRNLEKAREQELQLDYAEIVSKLSLLMGAGMSGASAFSKIAMDYKTSIKNKKGQFRHAYEEIVATTNRIATGTSESEAYAMFGRLCRIHCYVKLGSLLAQNVRKGGEGFTQAIRNEVTEAFVERKSMARRAGEEAGTKLLIPMGMMLCVVLVVIIVPAFMSF